MSGLNYEPIQVCTRKYREGNTMLKLGENGDLEIKGSVVKINKEEVGTITVKDREGNTMLKLGENGDLEIKGSVVKINKEEVKFESANLGDYGLSVYEPFHAIINQGIIKFAKVRPNAKIPSKNSEDIGYDIYACFDEDFVIINPHETVMIPTGIASSFSEEYGVILKERGSTGTKGMAQRAGVIDSGFRGEWWAPITNTTEKPIVIAKKGIELGFSEDMVTIYPYEKAICQAMIIMVPKMKIEEVSFEDLKAIPSRRGEGELGSSGK